MKHLKKITCTALAVMMGTLPLSACNSGGNSAGDDTTFSWWIYSGADSSYYMEYQENPAIQYSLQKHMDLKTRILHWNSGFLRPVPQRITIRR